MSLCYSASVPAEIPKEDDVAPGSLPQYHVEKSFADRRYKVQSARTYFYLNEATCERNMETFLHCLEAISGENIIIAFYSFFPFAYLILGD